MAPRASGGAVATSIRPARLSDVLAMAQVHHGAVHGLAGSHYSADLLAQWAPPVSLARAERLYREAQDSGAIHIVAETDGEIVGFGVVAPERSEIIACYVAASVARSGVGSALLGELEALARAAGCDHLSLHASLNAKGFYRAHLYRETGRGEHQFASGARMAAVFMRKDFV